eukprot:TRINITY_DN16801_c0_g2_i1.p1 TRINITY_DN16801_c0_g2~~TRINITY_DN16801_c0_g2_i1.p1  ORF type:complete len:172 (+),score=44.25 TRINITY_DN16801_c0_g2_i1:56-517(+)
MGIEGKAQMSGGASTVVRKGAGAVKSRKQGLEAVSGASVKIVRKNNSVNVKKRMTALMTYVEEKDKGLYTGVQEMMGRESVGTPVRTPLRTKPRTRLSINSTVYSPGMTKPAPDRLSGLQSFAKLSTPIQVRSKGKPLITERFTSLQQFVTEE